MGRWLSLPIYPFLLVAFSVLSLYASNLGEMYGGESLAPLAAMLTLAGAGFALSVWIVGDRHKAAFVSFVALIGLLYYDALLQALQDLLGAPFSGGLLLAALAAIVLALLFWLRRDRRSFRAASLVLNAAVAAPLAASLIAIMQFNLASRYPRSVEVVYDALAREVAALGPLQAAEKPSIFYLIFDRYASREVLRSQYGYDNGSFLRELRRRGFFVVEDSRSNYPTTPLSLASSLNFTHLGEVARVMGRDSRDRRPFMHLVRNSTVARVLRAAGYAHVNVGSYWDPTRLAPAADEAFVFDRLSEFARVYLRKTALRVLTRIYDPGLSRESNCRRVDYQFDKLDELAARREGVFVFAHLLTPHPPYTLDRDGRCTTQAEERAQTREENYLEQLRYANARILGFVDRALAGPGPKPIVVLQADEGPYPDRLAEREGAFDWRTAEDAEVVRKFGILSSFHFPDGDYSELRQGITPVNTFRVILRRIFDADLALLPDESYLYAATDRPYDFFPVTRRLSRRAAR